MSDIKSTRLRFVITKDEAQAALFIDSLPFKVEIKPINQPSAKKVVVWFVIPDNVKTFLSQDLR